MQSYISNLLANCGKELPFTAKLCHLASQATYLCQVHLDVIVTCVDLCNDGFTSRKPDLYCNVTWPGLGLVLIREQ